MSIVIKSRIKDFAVLDNKPLNVTGDFGDALGKKVEEMIHDACKRAKSNGRNTVMARDL